MRQAVDDAAGGDQIRALLDRADGRVDGAAADVNRPADQRHGRLVGAGDQHQLGVQPLPFEKALLLGDPQRAVTERLRRRAERKADFLLGGRLRNQRQPKHDEKRIN